MTNGVGGDNRQIPVNVQLDSNNIVTSATILNSSYFLDNTENMDHIEFVDINPSFEWQITDWGKINDMAYYDDSYIHRDMISLMFQTTLGSGITTTFNQAPGTGFPNCANECPGQQSEWGMAMVHHPRPASAPHNRYAGCASECDLWRCE